MNKLTTSISLIVLCLVLNSCGLKESVVEGLSQKMYNEITEAYIEYCDNKITNDDFKIDACFGKYNKGYVVLIQELGIHCPAIDMPLIQIGDSYFDFYCSEYIYVYYNDKLYGIKNAYDEGLLGNGDIEDISKKFKEYR